MSRSRAIAVYAAVLVLVGLGSIALSLWVTPMQEVSAAGQTVEVGVTAPSFDLSGPGELDLFGQRIDTSIHFAGPVRPRLSLTHISLSDQLAQLASRSPADAKHSLQRALVRGWEHFFAWQVVVVGLIAIVVMGAIAGWLRRGWRPTLVLIALGLVVTEALNLGAIMTTAYTTPDKLAKVGSLQALVGGSPPPALQPQRSRASSDIRRVAVIGDSTAAGQGNRPLPGGDADDKACHRSADTFAADLANANSWTVSNLACGGATIRAGLLGPQDAGGRTQPPQADASAVATADVVIVSIGANDLHWSELLRLCAVSQSCSNNAEQAYLQQQLSVFSTDLLQLLSQLQLLSNHPVVIVNRYYDPFAGDISCLTDKGLTSAKRLALESDLDAMNTVLSHGADAAGFATASPDFSDHGLCSDQSYVQGLDAPAPFHPTPSGELAIALADEHALHADTPGH